MSITHRLRTHVRRQEVELVSVTGRVPCSLTLRTSSVCAWSLVCPMTRGVGRISIAALLGIIYVRLETRRCLSRRAALLMWTRPLLRDRDVRMQLQLKSMLWLRSEHGPEDSADVNSSIVAWCWRLECSYSSSLWCDYDHSTSADVHSPIVAWSWRLLTENAATAQRERERERIIFMTHR